MQVALPIGNGKLMMRTDMLNSAGHKLTAGNNFSISISLENKEVADRIYNALSADGKI